MDISLFCTEFRTRSIGRLVVMVMNFRNAAWIWPALSSQSSSRPTFIRKQSRFWWAVKREANKIIWVFRLSGFWVSLFSRRNC